MTWSLNGPPAVGGVTCASQPGKLRSPDSHSGKSDTARAAPTPSRNPRAGGSLGRQAGGGCSGIYADGQILIYLPGL